MLTNKKTNKHFFGEIYLIFLLLLTLLTILPAAAQEAGPRPYQPITKVDLGIKSLTLDVGESYTFQISYEPKEPFMYALNWFISDSNIADIDAAAFTITAKKPGTARIMAESFDQVSFAVCDITVSGEQTQASGGQISGEQMLSLSKADRKKITSNILNRYINLIESVSFSQEAFTDMVSREFPVIASVKPGTEETESQHAYALGMSDATPLPAINAVAIQGTLDQIMRFTSGNSNLVEISGGEQHFLDDPITEDFSTESVQKSVDKLEGNAEKISSIGTAHKLGINGDGTTIAVLDTGLNPSHEQFKGRVTGQRCYSSSFQDGDVTYRNVCSSTNSAMPSNAITPKAFNHGSHVTGIAAGKDGVAPKAKIVAVQIFSEKVYPCAKGSYDQLYYQCDNYASSGKCCSSVYWGNDTLKAYQYLLDLSKKGTKIAAVNMSYSFFNSGLAGTCDNYDTTQTDYFKQMLQQGIIPVASAGNNGSNLLIYNPSCISHVVAVSALSTATTPKIAYYSNHNKIVTIAAPGTSIYSASYPSGYTYMQGTSMASPMVTGSFALLKQAFPDKKPAELKKLITDISTKTVDSRENGYKFGFKTKVLDLSKIGNYTIGKISITDTHQVRGYTNGITVKFPNVSGATGFLVTVKDKETGATVKPTVTVKKDSTGKYTIIDLNGTMLKNGHPYRISMTPYKKSGGSTIKGTTRTVNGAPNPRMTAITAVPGDKNVSVRVVPSKYADGFHYSVYQVNPKTKIKTIDVPKGANVVKKFTGLKNGTLYYVEAIPYAKIDGNKYYGASVYVIYFAPLSKPAGAKVSFSNNTTAKISMSADSSATGIKVMYRTPGGSMQNGCESSGASCSVNNLKKSGAYEFYVMKYKTINGKNHYGPGVTLTYKTTASGLPAPTNPLIAKRGSKLLTFTIDKASNAKGISVLYREGEGAFKQACEKAAATCEKDGFDWSKKYTFYIMQYKAVNGKKVYSPGVTVTNWLTPKTVGSEEEILAGLSYTESKAPDEIYEVLEDYMTEEDLEMYEAFDAMGVDESDYIEEIDELDGILEGDLELYDEAQPLDEYDDEEADTTGATEVNDPNPVETDPQSGETEYAEPTEEPQPGESDDPEPIPEPAEPEFQTMEFYWLSGADRYPYNKGVPSFNRK